MFYVFCSILYPEPLKEWLICRSHFKNCLILKFITSKSWSIYVLCIFQRILKNTFKIRLDFNGLKINPLHVTNKYTILHISLKHCA